MTPTHRVEHVRVEHVIENCPDGGTHRSGGWTQRTREVIDLPAVPVTGYRCTAPAGMEHQLQEVPYEANAT